MRCVSVPMFLVMGILLAGCQARAARPDVPAHVNNPTAESRAELLRVVRDALNGSEVTLADDALTKDSLLIIEPKHLTGRDLRRPEHFRLVLSGSRCVLVHQGTETRMRLMKTTCAVE